MIRNIIVLSLILILGACSIEPQEINYGSDACHYCSMTIVDRQHAAQLVTAKGRAYKYDAIECMINDIDRREDDIAILLVNDYSNPGALVQAESATYLISESIPSPMGAYLSAFTEAANAQAIKNSAGGEVFNWESVQSELPR